MNHDLWLVAALYAARSQEAGVVFDGAGEVKARRAFPGLGAALARRLQWVLSRRGRSRRDCAAGAVHDGF